MPRQKTHQISEKRGGHCKIRKRVSSSSSASSVAKNYRFKRAILVGKRTGSSTPVPTWKVLMASRSRSSIQQSQNFDNGDRYGILEGDGVWSNKCKGKEGFSARKLAASLWEINGLHSPVSGNGGVEKERGRKSSLCEKNDGSKVRGPRRRSSAASQNLQITEYFADTTGKSSSIEAGSQTQGENTCSFKVQLKNINNTLIASKEVVKALIRIFSQEEDQSSSRMTLVSALKHELDQARLQVEHLIQEDGHNSTEFNTLLKQFAEEKADWKRKEKERIRKSVSSIRREVEIERKLRRQAERLNKKLGMELADTRVQLSRAVKDLEVEKRAKEILEQTCDELEKVREEVEMERKMLQLADLLREERVQMKLQEARYEYEEKNAALERLKEELQNGDMIEFMKKTEIGSFRNVENEGGVDEEDSGESELHSIELSMDDKNKSLKWNFICEGGSRRGSLEEVFKGRKSLSEKVQWENICLQRTSSDGIEWDFSSVGIDKGVRLSCQGSACSTPAISSGKSSCLREACTAILQDLAARRDGSLNLGQTHTHCSTRESKIPNCGYPKLEYT